MVNFWGIIYTLLVVVIVCVDMSDIENTKVGKLLYNLGKYSMGMWFISGLFFMPSRELQFVAYFLFHMGNLFSYLWKDMLCSAGCTRFAKVIVLPSGGRESALL